MWNLQRHCVGFEDLTEGVLKSSVVWYITPCSPLKVNRCFGGICGPHAQVRRISRVRDHRGRAVALAVSRRLPPARQLAVEPMSCHVGFVVDKVTAGMIFFDYFGFPCTILIPPSATFIIIIYHPGLVQ
jgi:hypothetical protein